MYEELKERLIQAAKNEELVYYEEIAPMFGSIMTATAIGLKSVGF